MANPKHRVEIRIRLPDWIATRQSDWIIKDHYYIIGSPSYISDHYEVAVDSDIRT